MSEEPEVKPIKDIAEDNHKKSSQTRSLSVRNVYDKTYKTLELDGVWADVLGEPEANGAWLIYGKEKNGKTWMALMLAWYLSRKYKVLYVSAEEGVGKAFRASLVRVGFEADNRNMHLLEYEKIEDLKERLKKRKSPGIVIIDNLTIYNDELRGKAFHTFIKDHENKLFIFVAHEDRGEPYTASAKLCRKLAKVIMHVKGLACSVSGRVPGGMLVIDEQKAKLYHGQKIEDENKGNIPQPAVLPAPETERSLPRGGKKKNDSRSARRA